MRLRLLLGAELALRLTSLASLLPQPRRRRVARAEVGELRRLEEEREEAEEEAERKTRHGGRASGRLGGRARGRL